MASTWVMVFRLITNQEKCYLNYNETPLNTHQDDENL